MKNIKLIILSVLTLAFTGCESDDATTAQDLLNSVDRGAILRTIAIESPVFDATDVSSFFSVTIQEQDEKDGKLLESVDVFLTFDDRTPANGTNDKDEILFKNIPASAFTIDEFKLPRTNFKATLTEVVTAFGLTPAEFTGGDRVRIRFLLKLTDGRTFTDKDVASIVSSSSFFKAPFQYFAVLNCPFKQSTFSGNFEVVQDDWEDYSPGDIVPLAPGDNPDEFKILSTNNTAVINPNTSYMIVKVNPATATVTVTSNEPFKYLPAFILPVTGTGSVDTCNGDIKVVLAFGGFTGNTFILKKVVN